MHTLGWHCSARYHVVEAHFLCLHLLRYEAGVRLCLECAFQGDVRCATPHQLDEVPVLACAVAVTLDVAYQLAVCLACRVEAEGGLYLVVLQVAIYGLGTTYHLHSVLLGSIVFGQDAGVGVRVVAADYHEGLDAELAEDLDTALELGFLLQLCPSGADDVESAGIAVLVDEGIREFHVLVVNQAARSHEEAVKLAFGVQRLHAVVESAYYVVASGSLSAAQDDSHVEGSD